MKARGTGDDNTTLRATLVGVMVNGGTFTGNEVGIRFGDVQSPAGPQYWNPPTDITVRGANVTGNSGGDIVNYLNGVSIKN